MEALQAAVTHWEEAIERIDQLEAPVLVSIIIE